MNSKTVFPGLLLLPLFLLTCSSGIPGSEEIVREAINESHLIGHIQFLSDDLLGGRAPGSPGSILAQKYIQSQLQVLGLQPAFGGSYLQPFDVVEIHISPKMNLAITGKGFPLRPRYYQDYVAFPGVQKETIQVKGAEIVFVGYGIQAPEFDWDDYKDVDVQGKILLIMNNDPDSGDPGFFGGKARLYYGRWDYKYEQAARMGALGAIIIHTTPSAGYPWHVVQTSWTGPQFELPQKHPSPLRYKAWVTEEIARRIVQLSGNDLDQLRSAAEKRDFKPVSLKVKLDAKLQARYRAFQAANVGGVLLGSDARLKDQWVIFTAHYDHLGIGTAVKGDSIYNGALDNSSGVASILTLAGAYTRLKDRPRRSLLFLAVDGEESGLLGSRYYVEHPTVPAGRIAANINLDGANIWGNTREIALIGWGKSTIDKIVSECARRQGRSVVPDQNPEQGFFYRSDQFNFARIGVPALYPDGGLNFIGKPQGWGKKVTDEWNATHYHQPCDEYESSWDLSGQVEDLRLIFQVGYRIANQDQMPFWLPGDEFEAVRKKAIQEAGGN